MDIPGVSLSGDEYKTVTTDSTRSIDLLYSRPPVCERCMEREMTEYSKKSGDFLRFVCPNGDCPNECSIRKDSLFAGSKMSLPKFVVLLYEFCFEGESTDPPVSFSSRTIAKYHTQLKQIAINDIPSLPKVFPRV